MTRGHAEVSVRSGEARGSRAMRRRPSWRAEAWQRAVVGHPDMPSEMPTWTAIVAVLALSADPVSLTCTWTREGLGRAAARIEPRAGQSASTIARHLGVLRGAGLLDVLGRGRGILYRLVLPEQGTSSETVVHSERLDVLRMLARRSPATCAVLAQHLNLDELAVLRHLVDLHESGLVTTATGQEQPPGRGVVWVVAPPLAEYLVS